MQLRSLFCVALFILAAGCGGGSNGPQIRIFSGQPSPSSGAAIESGSVDTVGRSSSGVVVSSDGIHTVRRGNTLYAIARAYGVPLRALILENGLAPPYELEIGQKIRIPAVRTHTVRAGDTVYGISRRYGVSMNALVRANGIEAPYTIRVGQRLSIPAGSGPGSVVVSPVPPATPPQVAAAPPTVASSPEPPTPPAEPSYGPNGVVYPVAKPELPIRTVGPIPRPPSRTGDGFLWPVQGRIVSGFGPKPGGLHNDGINIAVPRGSPVRAADAGVVAYSGDGLQGFGNIVLVKHADGYVTAYAHADALLVTRGQIVKRGQAIARAGSTGTVASPQLHFQIRQGRNAIDPRKLLLSS